MDEVTKHLFKAGLVGKLPDNVANNPLVAKKLYDACLAAPDPKAAVGMLWKFGVLSWKLKPHQIALYNVLRNAEVELPEEQFVLECSRRFGKSSVLLLIAIENCLRKSGWFVDYMGPTQKQINEVLKPMVLATLTADCPASIRPSFKGQSSIFEFPNSSQISIFGVNEGNHEAGRGGTAHELIVDEAGMIDRLEYTLLDVFIPRLLTTNGHCKIASTPAITTDHDFYAIVQHAKDVKAHALYNHNNTHGYPQEEIDRAIKACRGSHTNRYRREYLCEWLIAEERRIVPEWTEDGNTVCEPERDEFYKFYHKYVCADFGFKNDYTAILFAYYDKKKAQLVIEDEWVAKGHDARTPEIARVVKEKEHDLWGNQPTWKKICDNTDGRLVADLATDHNVSFQETDKDSLAAMVQKVNEWAEQGRIVVNPRCTQTIGCLNSGVFNKNRDKFDRSKHYGHYDALAALMYLIRNVDEYTNPIPRNYKFDAYEMGTTTDFTKTEEEQLASQLFPGLDDFLGLNGR